MSGALLHDGKFYVASTSDRHKAQYWEPFDNELKAREYANGNAHILPTEDWWVFRASHDKKTTWAVAVYTSVTYIKTTEHGCPECLRTQAEGHAADCPLLPF